MPKRSAQFVPPAAESAPKVDPKAEAAFVAMLIANGQAAAPDSDGKLPTGATHELLKDSDGKLSVRRRRFSAT